MLDADYTLVSQDPIRARAILKLLGWLIVIFLIWASFTKVAEVTRGEGKVIPSARCRSCKAWTAAWSRTSRCTRATWCKRTRCWCALTRARFLSSVKEDRAEYLSLLAKAARLTALVDDKDFVAPPEVAAEDPRTLDEERRLYEAERDELDGSLAIARQELSQRQQELVELKAKRDQASKQYDFTLKELKATKPLLAVGAVSDVEVLRLERDVARYSGDREIAGAQILRVSAAIEEAERKIRETEITFRNEAGKDLAQPRPSSTRSQKAASACRTRSRALR